MKKLNNKGFSLVELIIVIAIMVILVAVIAPQYLKFVNNSKISTDVQTAADVVTALDVAIADGSKPFGSDTATTKALSTISVSNLEGDKVFSKYGTSWSFNVTGSDVVGVTKIVLTDGTSTYECYPNPDNTTDGINAKLKK